MTIQEQRRKAFEEWFDREKAAKIMGNADIAKRMYWEGWQAALDSACITLPDCTEELPDTEYGVSLCREAIHAAGVKTK